MSPPSSSLSSETPESFSAERYFATQPAPSTLENDINAVRGFIERNTKAGRKVVLVTSGGTTVPLELNVVRFLDNFSAGTRGATSAEYFLRAGYAVIFMHRQHSLQPFSRHYSHSTNPFLDFLEIEESDSESETNSIPTVTSNEERLQNVQNSLRGTDMEQLQERQREDRSGSGQYDRHSKKTQKQRHQKVVVQTSDLEHLRSVVSAYKAVRRAGTLHTMTFVTVNEYLWLLRAVSKELNVLGRRAMYYLAAAVSDFFLPRSKMSEHKIQSGKGSLVIEMDQVPKILKPMVDEWTPEGFIVSFKLETDSSILIPKARAALERYGHQVVIGNELHRRKFEVVFVSRRAKNESTAATATSSELKSTLTSTANLPASAFEERWLCIDEHATSSSTSGVGGVKEIEEDIIDELVKRHLAWIS